MTDLPIMYVITVEGDATDADFTGVTKRITSTGAEYRILGPLAKVLSRAEAERDRLREALERAKHDAKGWQAVAETMERSRDAARNLLRGPVDDCEHDPTNPFAPRERPKKSVRLMTDAERRAAGLDPNGGFDGPTGAD